MSSAPSSDPAGEILSMSVEDLRSRLQQVLEDHSKLQEQVVQSEARRLERETIFPELQAKMMEMAAEISELDSKLYSSQKEKDIIKQEILAMRSEYEAQQLQSTKREHQFAETKRMLSDSGEAYDAVCIELEEYQTGSRIGRKEHELNAEISSLQGKLRRAEAAATQMEAQAGGKEKAAQETKAANDKLVDSLQTEIYILKQEKIEIDDFLQKARDELAAERKQSVKPTRATGPTQEETLLKEHLTKLAEENDELQRSKEKLEEVLENTRRDLETERTKNEPLLLRTVTADQTAPALSDSEWARIRLETEGLKGDLLGAYDDVERLMIKHQETLANQPNLEQALQERTHAQQALGRVSQDADELAAATNRLGKTVQQLEKEKVKLQNQVQNLDKQNQTLERAMANRQAHNDDQSKASEAQMAQLQRDNIRMKKEIHSLTKTMDLAQAELHGLRRKIQQVTGEQQTAEDNLSWAKQDIEQLRAALKAKVDQRNSHKDSSTQVDFSPFPGEIKTDGSSSSSRHKRISQEKVSKPLRFQPIDGANAADTKVFLVLITLALTIALGLALFLSLLLHRERARWLLANDMTRRMLWQSVQKPSWFWMNELHRLANPLRVGRWG